MVVLINGVKYRLVTPENETTLEKALQSNYEHIFGPDSFYFDLKSKVRSRSGIGSIPDGYVIFFDPDPNPKWAILEVELASHPIYDHLIPQLTKFNRALEDSPTRRKLMDLLYTVISEDDRDKAARNGEEAVIEYLLLAQCNYLVHNGSSIARTVLLKVPEMPHVNTHGGQRVGCEANEVDSGEAYCSTKFPDSRREL